MNRYNKNDGLGTLSRNCCCAIQPCEGPTMEDARCEKCKKQTKEKVKKDVETERKSERRSEVERERVRVAKASE